MNIGRDGSLLSYNIFSYCKNNPIKYVDDCGHFAEIPPLVENGLNLPASGGVPVVIDGTTYYYAVGYSGSGALYEYWFDSEGNLVHARHHTNHNKPWNHDDPHDHPGGKDKDGNNTIGGKQEVDEKFQPPKQYSNFASQKATATALEYAAVGLISGYAIYKVAKWTIATLLAPSTGGGSYAVAMLMP